jgi:TolB-like protein/DNA-binding winged helix-turn-helix (wHTH) protein/Tfp pilus assembly protein PilF
MSALTNGFELEGLQVSPLTGEVSGPGGIAQLDPKVMAVLVLMGEHPGEVMLREDLVSRLWGNVVVTDDALTRCFYELRRHLSQAGGDERYRDLIETLPKRGYRLRATVNRATVKPVEATSNVAAAPAARRSRPWIPAIVAAVVLAAIGVAVYFSRSSQNPEPPTAAAAVHSIVVLPFLDMSAEKDQGYFADGVAEEILNRLAQSRNLRVTARTSAFALRDQALDVPQIAERLDVDYVLEGSVRKSGAHVRITAQLIDAHTNVHVWSNTYDGSLDDLFSFQDEIATAVAEALQATLAGDAARPQARPNAAAYEKFLHARFFHHRRSPGDIARATGLYRQAVELDPQYARAWAELAGTYSLTIWEQSGDADDRMRALHSQAAHRAVELDPQLAVAQARLAQYYYLTQQPEKGDEHMRLAVALEPDDSFVRGFRSDEAMSSGDFGAAVELWARIVAQDPLSPLSLGNYAHMLYVNGQYEKALIELRKALELNPAAEARLGMDIVRVLVLLGRYDEALQAVAKIPPGSERDYVLALLGRAPGRDAEAEAALGRLASAAEAASGVNEAKLRVQLAEIYVRRDRGDDALDSLLAYRRKLEADRDRPSRNQWTFQHDLRISPLLRPLQGDPRWAELTALPAAP